MTKEPKSRKLGKFRSLGLWLVPGAWGAGAFIYGWLLAGVRYEREYRSLNFEALGWADWSLATLCGVIACVLSLWASSDGKPAVRENKQLLRIVVAVLPALFLVSALAVLVLTLATYNGDWIEARQGLATAFAALIAAVGVVVSVAVSYKTGEENRLAQQENLKTQLESQQKNLETQLEHQRALEQEKGAREQQKLDAELIKNLNDRLHEIIPRRYGGKPAEVSGSYFQLATLYKDWGSLAGASPLISRQKESQQRNILKLLFGVYQEKGENDSENREELDVRTLNSVVQDVFLIYQNGKNKNVKMQEKELGAEDRKTDITIFDLSYLDLRGLDISKKDLSCANLTGVCLNRANLWGARLVEADLVDARLVEVNLSRANLERANLRQAHLEKANMLGAQMREISLLGADLRGVKLQRAYLGRADLWEAHLEKANLWGANLTGANLQRADFKGANLRSACLEGADLWDARLEGADIRGARMEGVSFFGFRESPQGADVRERVINQLKEARYLPNRDELLKAKDFDQALVDDIIKAHKEHHRQNQQ